MLKMLKTKGPDFLGVGLEKSGNHWIAALLSAHPDISCFPVMPFVKESGEYNRENVGELHIFNSLASLEPGTEDKFVRPLTDYSDRYNKLFSDLVPYLDKVPKAEIYRMFLDRYNEICESERHGKKLVGEATPAYVFHLDFIDSFYPNIKKLCVIREPRDRVVSWHFHQIRRGRIENSNKLSDQFIIDYCEKRIRKEYQALLDYSGNIHCLTYEGLSKTPHPVIRGTLKYLDVPADDEVIDEMLKAASFEKLTAKDSGGKGREQGEESIMSHFRKGIVGDWKNYLADTQVKLVDPITLDLQNQVFKKYNVEQPNQ